MIAMRLQSLFLKVSLCAQIAGVQAYKRTQSSNYKQWLSYRAVLLTSLSHQFPPPSPPLHTHKHKFVFVQLPSSGFQAHLVPVDYRTRKVTVHLSQKKNKKHFFSSLLWFSLLPKLNGRSHKHFEHPIVKCSTMSHGWF